MAENKLSYQATLQPDLCERDLKSLFVSGCIGDHDLHRRIAKLSEMYKVYASTCHVPVWAKGLAITDEICRITELYLECCTIKRALCSLIRKSIRIICEPPPVLCMADSWLKFLSMVAGPNESANPALLIERLAGNEKERLNFLFSVFLPQQFGGSFARYPGQMDMVRNWAGAGNATNNAPVHCLDAACGSGEGSYGLARVLIDCGVDPSRIRVTGVTINPLEVFAAAHAFFPHDLQRQQAYREYVEHDGMSGVLPNISFITDDLKSWQPIAGYQIILCNGILGGPQMSGYTEIEDVLGRLAASLHAGGMLLVADRFHGGWEKRLSRENKETLLSKCGLKVIPVSEGVAGLRV